MRNDRLEPLRKLIEESRAHIAEMFEAHEGDLNTILDESDTPKCGIAIAVAMDFAADKPTVKTTLTVQRPIKDSRASELDDPNQASFSFDEPPRIEIRVLPDGNGSATPRDDETQSDEAPPTDAPLVPPEAQSSEDPFAAPKKRRKKKADEPLATEHA